ncbi:erythrulose kinase [Actinocatenispora thailandica]|uniref:Erythrulose kinase n=1 Tax=Actinocatenispora thailandica TaxID=227318 RepID=A0A7R7DLT9_9ACTN|nr:dihydroxyacetone kinase family protein [Actinocatenispora thailandica]BCJ33737.1 erythrulose kinase [Actinocatenispora thailandica]
MAHIYGDPAAFPDEMVDGFCAAYSRYVERVPDTSVVMRRGGPRAGKVSVIIGGGSGHYPAFCGTVGAGLADAAVVGDIFTSPSAEQAYRAGRALSGGAGVLFSFGNYAGDVMNFGAAQRRLVADGIDCRTVLVTDDVASAPAAEAAKRRGIAGDLCVFKIAGAAAERGDDLDTVERLARKANASTRSFGVAFAGCTVPGADAPLFVVDPAEMELGLGIHGEPGIQTVPRQRVGELAATLAAPLLAERPAGAGDRVAVLLNGLGGTKYEELFVLWRHLDAILADAGLTVLLPEVGELVTSLDMGGVSLTLLWLDDELAELWSAPADTPAFRRGSLTAAPPGAGTAPETAGSGAEAARIPGARRGGAAATDPAVPGDATGAIPATAAELSTVDPGAGSAPTCAEPDPDSVRAAGLARSALAAMLAVAERSAADWGRIDAVAGDGDHGTGMVRGLRAASAAADGYEGGVGSTLGAAGAAFGDKAGGTSGMLWGVMLGAVGAAFGDDVAPDRGRLRAGVRAGITEVATVGGARLGDKTMLDVLLPFADAFEAALDAGADSAAAWRTAVAAAERAATATADLVPKVGRARPLAARSVGTPDAGATSMAACLRAAGEAIFGTGEKGA